MLFVNIFVYSSGNYMNYRELTYLGLSEKEAKVYLATLELGKASVQNISKKAEVNRATTYVVIEALMKKGLMTSIEQNKKQYFQAEPPEKLRMLFESMETEIVRKLDYLDKMLPELKVLYATQKGKPVVRYFEGKEGMKAMFEEFFIDKHTEPARMIFSNDLLFDYFTDDELNNFIKRSISKGVKVRSIFNDEKKQIEIEDGDFRIDAEKYPITSDIAIFGNKVRIATQRGGLVGLIIENKEIADTLKTLFELAFKNKKFGK